MKLFDRRLGGALLVVTVVACSNPRERAECSTSASCGPQAYCAHTPDGSVCWPDTQVPVVQSVTVTCGTPCLRDGQLQVSAMATDDQALAEVTASIPVLDQVRSVPMSRSNGKWVATLALAEWPFRFFEQPVAVKVTARDEAGNEASVDAAGAEVQVVTRLRSGWTYDAGVPITSPAVLSDGTAIFGRSATSDQVVAVREGQKLWSATVGSTFVTAPPSVGEHVWVGNQGGVVYPITLEGAVIGAGCITPGPINAPVAVEGTRGIAGSAGSRVVVVDSGGFCNQTSVVGQVHFSPVIAETATVYAASGSTLYSFAVANDGVLSDNWTGADSAPARPTLSGAANAPLALNGSSILTLASSGKLDATSATALVQLITTVSPNSVGPIVLADGSMIVGDTTGIIKRIADPSPAWSESAVLDGVPGIPLVLSGEAPFLIVPTSTGRLYAIDAADGTIAWSVKLSTTGQALQPANIHTEPGASTSTAYVAGADGKLYAVIVDGRLDTDAPWPKAFHDPRNTSNAGVAP